jgi:hypothetical protein
LLVEPEILDFTLILADKYSNLIGGGVPPPYKWIYRTVRRTTICVWQKWGVEIVPN